MEKLVEESWYDEEDASEVEEDLEFDHQPTIQKKRINKSINKGIKAKPVQCPKCEKMLSNKQSLAIHLQSVSPCTIPKQPKQNKKVIYKPASCPECKKVFTQRENMKIHLKSIHQGIKLKCQYCSKTASNKSNLQKHIRHYCPSKPI